MRGRAAATTAFTFAAQSAWNAGSSGHFLLSWLLPPKASSTGAKSETYRMDGEHHQPISMTSGATSREISPISRPISA